MSVSSPIVIDITDEDVDMLPGVEDMSTSQGSSLDADPELKWALEQSRAALAESGSGGAGDNAENPELFRAAVSGAECGALTPVRAYLDAGGSLDRRVTADDAAALELSSSVPKNTLLDVALYRRHTDVVMELIERNTPACDDDEDVASRHRRRRLSEDLIDTAGRARLELRSRLRQREDGLVHVDSDAVSGGGGGGNGGGALCLPGLLSPAATALFGEGDDSATPINQALSWWNSSMAEYGHELATLYTPGDLNCLLHATALAVSGAADRLLPPEAREWAGGLLPWESGGLEALGALRCALAATLAQPPAALREQLATGGGPPCERLAEIAATDRTSLFREHVSALSSVLRRVIIVYAPQDCEVRSPPSVENRMSGVSVI